jgi:hypothetical protein
VVALKIFGDDTPCAKVDWHLAVPACHEYLLVQVVLPTLLAKTGETDEEYRPGKLPKALQWDIQ